MPGPQLQSDDPHWEFHLDGLRWEHEGNGRALKPDSLVVQTGQTGVVLADGTADAETFTDVLLGQAWPIRGRILIGHREITSLSSEERGIAFVPAGGSLFPHLTVEQNIEFGVRNRHPDNSRKEHANHRKGHVNLVAGRLNLHGFLGWRPHDLSPDERLRVALARAMCHWPTAEAVVIEDRAGYPPCHVAVSESLKAYPDLPVLVVSDDRHRVEMLRTPAASWEVVDADGP
ncbi:ABC-type taurine transport system ATPase subunit [Streptosporangium album]|uniref:ABC-type taurine transport system ATPase subunit n=1 Tax=Streptosporangium album TaxID=47479 RepID=A0A7W7S6R2_9ACTN|nr:ATP-binding cassette domain-containing protein [Streptosporangium album]MBB4943901.1 ABC-type taurine transport system ATPase subunit [Streptosporangium album]